jgi:hypothetical protein
MVFSKRKLNLYRNFAIQNIIYKLYEENFIYRVLLANGW